MIPQIILLVSWGIFLWLIKRDIARRRGISSAIWIPTLWVAVICSRPLSFWLGFGGGDDSLEGSPLDRLFFFAMIFLALMKLSKRRIAWGKMISRNWPIFLFYGYLMASVLWAEFPFVSFKRWFKELGNIFIAMLILTEEEPEEAARAVFVRCAYVLLPLSIVFIRYFPSLGRNYTISGALEPVGVTSQKNSLGTLVTVSGLILMWDWFERSRKGAPKMDKLDRYLPLSFLLIGAYLLYQCDSKTSILCLMISACILAASRIPFLRTRLSMLGVSSLFAAIAFYVLDWAFGLKETIVTSLGRDMTFTGRTDLWRELLALNTDRWIGTGFLSFWSDKKYQSQLPYYLADGRSAHNGFLEVFLEGGGIGVFFLIVMLLGVGWQIHRKLSVGGDYVLIRFAVFVSVLIGDLTESHFAIMSPLGFLFLLTAIGTVPTRQRQRTPMANRVSHSRVNPFDSTVGSHAR